MLIYGGRMWRHKGDIRERNLWLLGAKWRGLWRRCLFPNITSKSYFIKMQTLRQGAFCVEDYVKEFGILMIFCDLQEPQKKTIARFISGLHKEIVDAVELQPYVSLEDVIKLVVKIRRQQKRGAARVTNPYGSSSTSSYPLRQPLNLSLRRRPPTNHGW